MRAAEVQVILSNCPEADTHWADTDRRWSRDRRPGASLSPPRASRRAPRTRRPGRRAARGGWAGPNSTPRAPIPGSTAAIALARRSRCPASARCSVPTRRNPRPPPPTPSGTVVLLRPTWGQYVPVGCTIHGGFRAPWTSQAPSCTVSAVLSARWIREEKSLRLEPAGCQESTLPGARRYSDAAQVPGRRLGAAAPYRSL